MARYQNLERLLVFKLGGGEVPLPPPAIESEQYDIPSGLPTDPDIIALGKEKYASYCTQCHIPRSTLSGFPRLWNMSPNVQTSFDSIVLEGAFAHAGMASFADVLTPEDTLAIRAYIAEDRRALESGREETQRIDQH